MTKVIDLRLEFPPTANKITEKIKFYILRFLSRLVGESLVDFQRKVT